MESADKSYKGVLEEKVARRDDIVNELQETCMLWDVGNKFDVNEDTEIVRGLASVLLPRLINSLE